MSKEAIVEKLSKIKNLLFLCMCLAVHVMNVIIFLTLAYMPLVYLNIVSTIIYVVLLCFYHKNSENLLIVAYYEIIVFCMISEILCGDFGYIFFIIGMVSVICYLIPSNKKYRTLIQLGGFACAMILMVLKVNDVIVFRDIAKDAARYHDFFYLLNLFITLFTIFYCSSLYLVDLNMTKQKLDYNSNHDMLTGLYNRRFLNYVFERNTKEHNSEYAIAMIDIDDFKKVNDTYGHAAGDLVLEKLSDIMMKRIKQDDLAVRWGGEEFIIYMPNTKIDEAYSIVNSVVDEFRKTPVIYNEYQIKATVTAGIAVGNDIVNYEKVITDSDDKLYLGKQQGKNCIVK